MNEYPKQIPHPCGFKTMTVYTAEEERTAYQTNDEWRRAHHAAAAATRDGVDLHPAPVDRTPTTRLSLNKGA